jgi:soluble lytic murein transglycosylase-like protein
MTLWKTLRGGRADNPACPEARRVCAHELSVLQHTSAPSGKTTPSCALLRHLSSSSVPLRSALAILATFFLLSPSPAYAQIRKLVEENGHIVFVNADDNTPARTGRGKGANSNSALAAASRAGSALPPGERDEHGYRVLSRAEIDKYVEELAAKHNVDPELIRAVIAAESGYNAAATSRKGAQGLMQLMPGTAQQLGVRDAYNAKQNLEAGVRYLRALLDKYNGDLDKALAAYNAGEGAVARAGGVPNIRETQNYVRRITDQYFHGDPTGAHSWMPAPRTIRREVDANGKVIFTNE